ncbi:MAG: GNAT family protein [Bacillota bacterium]
MLAGDRIQIRPLDGADIAALLLWDDDPEITEFIGKKFPNLGMVQEWITALSHRTRRAFAIENGNGELIGELELTDIQWGSGRAELVVVIGERANWGKGLGTEAVRLALRYAFEEVGLREVWLRVYRRNRRAIRCYEKCGFRKEGILRCSERHEGLQDDVLLMTITRTEYRGWADG